MRNGNVKAIYKIEVDWWTNIGLTGVIGEDSQYSTSLSSLIKKTIVY